MGAGRAGESGWAGVLNKGRAGKAAQGGVGFGFDPKSFRQDVTGRHINAGRTSHVCVTIGSDRAAAVCDLTGKIGGAIDGPAVIYQLGRQSVFEGHTGQGAGGVIFVDNFVEVSAAAGN